MVSSFRGDLGVYIKNLENGKTVAINADTIFPTASMVKIPILVATMNEINKGNLSYRQELRYRDSLLYAGVDILGSFKDSQQIELSKVMMLMLTMSDNTASLWLQKLVGGGAVINALMDSLGFQHTRVNSRTPGREGARKIYGWGQTTPREMAGLVEGIVHRKLLDPSSSEQMLRLLSRNYWDEVALSQIPAGVFVASKNGAVDESRSEVFFVNAKGAPYICCITTKNNKDESWEKNNEAWELTRKLSKLLWDHFNN